MILGLDISSSCIGYSIFDMDGKLIELNCVKFRDKLTLFEKLEEFKKSTEHFKKLDIQFIAIEEPLKKFMGKFSSASTIALLNFFNGMISSYIYIEFGIEPIYFNVNNARSLVFPKPKKVTSKKSALDSEEELEPALEQEEKGSVKHEIWKKVMELEPLINWRYGPKSRKLLDENYDMADSYVIGIAMLITLDKQTKTA
jgi:hypothetical protein